MFRQFYVNDEGVKTTDKPKSWYAVVKVKDVIFGLLLASVVLVGCHAWFHQQHQIEVLQNQFDYLHKTFAYFQHFSTGQ